MAGAEEVPESVLSGLRSEDFESRETAQRALENWAKDLPEAGTKQLLRLARHHPEAEVRLRCLEVLRDEVAGIYDSQGQGYLGILMDDQVVKIPGGDQKPVPAVLIREVVPGASADRAGLRKGDFITAIAGAELGSVPGGRTVTNALRERIQALKPRSTVEVVVVRDGETRTIPVTLGRRPAALDEMMYERSYERISQLERQRKEEHFQKWLMENDPGRSLPPKVPKQ